MQILRIMWAYERRVMQRAAHDWLAFFGLPGLGLYLVAVICGFLLVRLFLGQVSMKEEIWIWLLTAACPALVVLLCYLFRAGALIDREQQEQIFSLASQLTSQLELVWLSDAVREVNGPGSPSVIEGKLGHVVIRNKSESEPARSVEVSILSYIELPSNMEMDLDAAIYSDSTQELRVNLNPGRHVRFNVFKVKCGARKLRLGPFANQRRNNLLPGQYRIRLIASAEAGRSVQEDCFLDFGGYEHIEFRRWESRDAENWSSPAG